MKDYCILRYDNEEGIYRVFKQQEDFVLKLFYQKIKKKK